MISIQYFAFNIEYVSVIYSHSFNILHHSIRKSHNFPVVTSFFNYKNKLPLHLWSSLVYKFSCVQCTSEHVWMTTRTLGIRVDEHKGVSFRTGVRLTQDV